MDQPLKAAHVLDQPQVEAHVMSNPTNLVDAEGQLREAAHAGATIHTGHTSQHAKLRPLCAIMEDVTYDDAHMDVDKGVKKVRFNLEKNTSHFVLA